MELRNYHVSIAAYCSFFRAVSASEFSVLSSECLNGAISDYIWLMWLVLLVAMIFGVILAYDAVNIPEGSLYNISEAKVSLGSVTSFLIAGQPAAVFVVQSTFSNTGKICSFSENITIITISLSIAVVAGAAPTINKFKFRPNGMTRLQILSSTALTLGALWALILEAAILVFLLSVPDKNKIIPPYGLVFICLLMLAAGIVLSLLERKRIRNLPIVNPDPSQIPSPSRNIFGDFHSDPHSLVQIFAVDSTIAAIAHLEIMTHILDRAGDEAAILEQREFYRELLKRLYQFVLNQGPQELPPAVLPDRLFRMQALNLSGGRETRILGVFQEISQRLQSDETVYEWHKQGLKIALENSPSHLKTCLAEWFQ